ncbi:hypothetical protein C0J52_26443 [Blattella germanica]|nr:hypothetical protein C0J52_26443 [Blattella germanica]
MIAYSSSFSVFCKILNYLNETQCEIIGFYGVQNSILRHEVGKWLLQNRGDDYKNQGNSVIHFTNVYCTVFFCTIVCFENNMFKKFNIQNICHSTNS